MVDEYRLSREGVLFIWVGEGDNEVWVLFEVEKLLELLGRGSRVAKSFFVSVRGIRCRTYMLGGTAFHDLKTGNLGALSTRGRGPLFITGDRRKGFNSTV